MVANALPRATCKPFDHSRAKSAMPGAFEHSSRAVGVDVGPCLIAKNLEADNTLFERGVVQSGCADDT